ncbi:UNVERIFIED_CONTAM: hypothetical protein HDU68_007710 [Siphonaria sp. JEL0065]|nr:hypothetical protein HDU68_007710 [Siphonaria sp. JEL0065]
MTSPAPEHFLPPLYRNLAAHNVRTSLHYTQLRTVSDPTNHIGDSFLLHPSSHSETLITKENAKCLVFPRVQRAKRRVKEIEQRVEQEMSSRFEGLTDDQRNSVLSLVSTNTLLRNLNQKAINYNSSKRRGSLGYKSITVDDFSAVNDLLSAEIPDFLVHEHLLISDKEKQEEEEEKRRKEQKRLDDELWDEDDGDGGKGSSSRSLANQQHQQHLSRRPELTPKAKYSKMVSQIKQAESFIAPPGTIQQQDPNNPPGYEEMKRVTRSLYEWSQNMINEPINLLNNKNLPQITPNTILPPRNATPPKNNNTSSTTNDSQKSQSDQSNLSPSNININSSSLQPSSNQPQSPQDPTSLSSATLNPAQSCTNTASQQQQQQQQDQKEEQATTYGEFDVLLNACKPVAAESKLSIRLNVMQETNPPQALIQSLKANLGYDIKTHVETIKVEEVERSVRGFNFSSHPKPEYTSTLSKKRHQYGNWYIKPSMWNEYMLKSGAEKNPKPREKMGGLVQQKLDAIMVNRAKEEAAFQAALLQSFGAVVLAKAAVGDKEKEGKEKDGGNGGGGGASRGGDAVGSRQQSRQVSRQVSRQSSFANLIHEGGKSVSQVQLSGGGPSGSVVRQPSMLRRDQTKSQSSIASVPEEVA